MAGLPTECRGGLASFGHPLDNAEPIQVKEDRVQCNLLSECCGVALCAQALRKFSMAQLEHLARAHPEAQVKVNGKTLQGLVPCLMAEKLASQQAA